MSLIRCYAVLIPEKEALDRASSSNIAARSSTLFRSPLRCANSLSSAIWGQSTGCYLGSTASYVESSSTPQPILLLVVGALPICLRRWVNVCLRLIFCIFPRSLPWQPLLIIGTDWTV